MVQFGLIGDNLKNNLSYFFQDCLKRAVSFFSFIKFCNFTKTITMKNLLKVLLVVFIILQFFRIDKTNPPVDKNMDFLTIKKTPENVSTLIKSACYDCHSNETIYPWYSNIQPFGWFLKDHIDEGRRELNFSTLQLMSLQDKPEN
jgi:hypothetical protein